MRRIWIESELGVGTTVYFFCHDHPQTQRLLIYETGGSG